jgi:predicted Rossmann fold nucleotide-binding protein DprA/Smf involved in DNA uptake
LDKGGFRNITAIGNLSLLGHRLLGLVCSQKCPGDAILKTFDLARALRDNGVPVVSGFHTPMERECLALLLRGSQPVVICPARAIDRMRVPQAWRVALEADRLLVLSPFQARNRSPTAELAHRRNEFVATLADKILVAHASPDSKTERLCCGLLKQGKQVLLLESVNNENLLALGAAALSLPKLIAFLAPMATQQSADENV